jgi:hypothetical protein
MNKDAEAWISRTCIQNNLNIPVFLHAAMEWAYRDALAECRRMRNAFDKIADDDGVRTADKIIAVIQRRLK